MRWKWAEEMTLKVLRKTDWLRRNLQAGDETNRVRKADSAPLGCFAWVIR